MENYNKCYDCRTILTIENRSDLDENYCEDCMNLRIEAKKMYSAPPII